VLLSGIALSCTTLLEEVGWTGFAIPRLRLRYGVLTTGLIVGILWGVWHLLQIVWVGRTSAAGLPLAVYLPLYFFSGVGALTAYRVLMVWVYDHAESLLVATLMHASYAACTIVILSPGVTGASFLIYSWVFTAVLWAVVALVTVANGRQKSLATTTQARAGYAREVPAGTGQHG
jgi:membrane protease YdiL (CAAX protease family)